MSGVLHFGRFELGILEDGSEGIDLLSSHDTRIVVEHVVEESLAIFQKSLEGLPIVIFHLTFHNNQQSLSNKHKLCRSIRHFR